MSEYSLKKLGVTFAKFKQTRSEAALNTLIEAAQKIVDEGATTGFNARTLSKVSGYSLGALVQRLGKVENIFLHAIAYGRERQLKELCEYAESFDPQKTARAFVEFMIDRCFATLLKAGPSVIRYYESRAMGRTNSVGDIYVYTDEVVPSLIKVMADNKTGTFREMTPHEVKYLARALFVFLERPFVESDPIAGTEIHRQMAVLHSSSMFSKI